MLEKVERVTASMQVVNSIKSALQKGKIKIGDKLPIEAELAQQLGVGRSSVREGIRILAAYGVVEVRQGDGTYVTNRFAEHVFEFMGFLPTADNILYMQEMRKVLEIGCLSIICDKITDEQCEELCVLAEALEPGGITERNIEVDATFHTKLVQHTENPLLIETYNMMRALIGALMSELMCRENVVRDARESHLKICQALKEHDYNKLYNYFKEHLDKVYDYSIEYYPVGSPNEEEQE